jgi:SAM-dependent methyltransferase
MKKEKKYFSHENMSAEERWKLMKKKYETSNFLIRKLVNNFYSNLFQLLKISVHSDSRILEIGCGAAESSLKIYYYLEQQNEKFYFEASEHDDRYIEIMRGMSFPFDIKKESVYELNREDNSFDIILLLEVLEHLEDVEKAIQEIARVSDKYFIISVPNEPLWRILNMCRLKYLKHYGNTPGHINHFNKKKLIETISKYAEVIEFKRTLPWIMVLAKVK